MFRTVDEVREKTNEELRNRRIKRLLQVRKQSKYISKEGVETYRDFLEEDKRRILERCRKELELKKKMEIERIRREYEKRQNGYLSKAHVDARRVHQENIKEAQDNFWTYMNAYERKRKRYRNAINEGSFNTQVKQFPKEVRSYRRKKVKFEEEKRRLDLHSNSDDVPQGMEKCSYKLVSKCMNKVTPRNPFAEIANPNVRRNFTENHYENTYFHERKMSPKSEKNTKLYVENNLPIKRQQICVNSKRTFGHIVCCDDDEVINGWRSRKNGVVSVVKEKKIDPKLSALRMKSETKRLDSVKIENESERRERYKRAIKRGQQAFKILKSQKAEKEEKRMFDNLLKKDLQRRIDQIPLKINETISDRFGEVKKQQKLEHVFEKHFLKKRHR